MADICYQMVLTVITYFFFLSGFPSLLLIDTKLRVQLFPAPVSLSEIKISTWAQYHSQIFCTN